MAVIRRSFILWLLSLSESVAFLIGSPSRARLGSVFSTPATESAIKDGDVLFSDSDDADVESLMDAEFNLKDDEDEKELVRKPHARWSNLKTNTRHKSQKQPQDRVVQNRRESKQDKKRRIMMFMKQAERDRKRAARVDRKIPLDMRTPLSALRPGTKLSGIVISLTHFGAYVDIGTECDGLLHIGQISNTHFVEHPKDVLTPGEEIDVTIKSLNPELKKLHLTMLELEEEEDDADERILLDELEVDDELWGEIVRVTDYGAYVELGAVVKGFLHFMDHPIFGNEAGAHPSSYMDVGQRVRVWVSDVDKYRSRIKLTANRPRHLPGPRRELF